MNKENFTLDRVDRKDEHEDYWFKTDEISDKELSDKYMEMCMIGVTEVVYSKEEFDKFLEETGYSKGE